jgi:hypothetical protein
MMWLSHARMYGCLMPVQQKQDCMPVPSQQKQEQTQQKQKQKAAAKVSRQSNAFIAHLNIRNSHCCKSMSSSAPAPRVLLSENSRTMLQG